MQNGLCENGEYIQENSWRNLGSDKADKVVRT